MKPVVEATGGMVVQTDTFLNPVFKESFKRVFAGEAEDGYLAVASNATFEARAPAWVPSCRVFRGRLVCRCLVQGPCPAALPQLAYGSHASCGVPHVV